MKKIILTLTYLFTFNIALYAQEGIVKNIVNHRTDKHQNVFNSKVFLVYPEGFKNGFSFIGLTNGKEQIQVFDIVGGNYESNSRTFNSENFEKKGLSVISFDLIRVNGFPAKLLIAESNGYLWQSLIFGDSTFCAMVQGIAPIENKLLNSQIKTSILSIVYDKNYKFDFLKNAPFTLESSIYKLANFTGGLYIFTLDGKIHEDKKTLPGLVASCLPNNGSPESIANNNLMEINNNTSGIFITKNKSSLELNGNNAYESENYAFIDGNKQLFYQLVIVKDDRAVLLNGFAFEDLEENLRKIKLAAHSLKLK